MKDTSANYFYCHMCGALIPPGEYHECPVLCPPSNSYTITTGGIDDRIGRIIDLLEEIREELIRND